MSAEAVGAAGRLILVADDDEMILQVVAVVLEAEGYRVLQARNGDEALALARAEPPALMLLDMRMPARNGWDVAAELRRAPGPRVPIVVMTATLDGAEWAAEVGADAHLAKPFDLERLLEVVRALLP